MSVLPKTRLPMRIIALPLTSAVRGPGHTVEPSPLVYYHFQMPPKIENRRGGWVDWVTGKAASVWAQFGKAPEGSWKVRVCDPTPDYRIKGRGLTVIVARRFHSQTSSRSLRTGRGWSTASILKNWPSKAWTHQWAPKYRAHEARARSKIKPHLYVSLLGAGWLLLNISPELL